MGSHRLEPPTARLVLEDRSIFTGRAFGACREPRTVVGEVVFNTAMTGYQEALTDPSYAGQILAMTATQIGNYGVCPADIESARPHVTGFVTREISRLRSSHRSIEDLDTWLARHGVLAIDGIDTRGLVKRLRSAGAMRGLITCDPSGAPEDLLAAVLAAPHMSGCNLAAGVSPVVGGQWPASPMTDAKVVAESRLRVLALDCGAKQTIYRNLAERGCEIRVLPLDTEAPRIREMGADGLFISNGPGDPAAIGRTIATLRDVAGEIPTFGICLGHQLLALALGAETYKLPFGHRGANQPVRNLLTNRVEITSQNHGFCVRAETLPRTDCEPTHEHLNDGTLAGFRHCSKPLFCVQYHPEASPGPHDSAYLFDCFVEIMRTRRPVDRAIMSRFQSPHQEAITG